MPSLPVIVMILGSKFPLISCARFGVVAPLLMDPIHLRARLSSPAQSHDHRPGPHPVPKVVQLLRVSFTRSFFCLSVVYLVFLSPALSTSSLSPSCSIFCFLASRLSEAVRLFGAGFPQFSVAGPPFWSNKKLIESANRSQTQKINTPSPLSTPSAHSFFLHTVSCTHPSPPSVAAHGNLLPLP